MKQLDSFAERLITSGTSFAAVAVCLSHVLVNHAIYKVKLMRSPVVFLDVTPIRMEHQIGRRDPVLCPYRALSFIWIAGRNKPLASALTLGHNSLIQ